ncbi:MAG: DUF1302 family protein [Cellvibrionales bacterium]|nr:DUF1302 family protein [Cellvibrionales bacterium]
MLKFKPAAAAASLLSLFSIQGQAASFEYDNFTIDWDTSITAGAQMRIEERNPAISVGAKGDNIVGQRPNLDAGHGTLPLHDLDDLQKVLDNAFIINSNDGNNSFDVGDFTSLRLSVLSEADINFGDWGIFVRGKMWQDYAYTQGTGIEVGTDAWYSYNANPALAHPNPAAPGQFNPAGANYSKQGYKLLDTFLYGSFMIPMTEKEVSYRIGRQVISWGEALLSGGGISQGINHVDSDIINQPGFDLKELFQPTGAIFGQLALNDYVNVEAYYQYEWNPVIIAPSGSYNNEFDSIGAGGDTFMFLTGQETRILGHDITDPTDEDAYALRQFLQVGCKPGDDRDSRCMGLVPYHLRTNEPGNNGQFGVAFNFFLDNGDEAGLYYVNYHEKIPSFILPIDAIEIMAPIIDVLVAVADPDEYQKTLAPQGGFQGIEDLGWKLSTKQLTALLGLLGALPPEDGSISEIIQYVLGKPEILEGILPDQFYGVLESCANSTICSFTAAGGASAGANIFLKPFGFDSNTVIRSLNYRLQYFDNVQMLGATYSTVVGSANVATEVSYRMNTPLLGGDVPRTPKRWQLINWHINTLMVFEPNWLWDFSSFTAEALLWYVPGALEYNANDLSNPDRLAVQNTPYGLGLSMFWSWEYQNVFQGWDIIIPWYVNYGAIGAAFNSGYRNGQATFATGATFRHLSGLELGTGVKMNFGEQDDQFQMMTQDRDSVNFTVKYSF